MHHTVSNYDIVVFDMEDALVDQGKSLPAAVARGVDAYLTTLLGVGPEGGPVFDPDEVRAFTTAQGFESDADVLQAMLAAVLHSLPVDLREDDFGSLEGHDLLQAVRATGRIVETLQTIKARKNLAEFGRMLRSRGGGKRGFGRVQGLRNRWLVLAEGHIMMDNFVKRVLAEAYLGEELFHKEHGQPRQFVTADGTIGLEGSWIDPEDLASVRKRCPMAAVTRRSQAEAQHVLERIGIGRFIDVVVGRGAMGMGMGSEDEAGWISTLGVGETSVADYPTKVTEAIERLRGQEGIESIIRVAYVGSCVPDARGFPTLKERYRLTAIGCAFGQDKKVLSMQREKGADFAIAEPQHLLRVLSERPSPRQQEHPGY